MQFIETFRENQNISDIYYCKKAELLTGKNGKNYYSVTLQDKTGVVDAKIFDLGNPGIEDFDAGDYVKVEGLVTIFQGNVQLKIERIYRVQEGQYRVEDYMPCSEYDVEEMFSELMSILQKVKEPHLKQLLDAFFKDEEFVKRFQFHSAAKSVHHGFIGGLLEHTLHVVKMCDFYSSLYKELNVDLLLTAAALHDVAKMTELSAFPENDYTDDGQLLGHIIMGILEIDRKIEKIEGFPHVLRSELEHCIASHHGLLEYGSPKKPALMEAMALHHADNTDAKLETFKESIKNAPGTEWLGFNRMLDSNIRKTSGGCKTVS